MDAGDAQWRYTGLIGILVVSALLLAARLVYLFVADSSRFPVATVKIVAPCQHVHREDLEEVLLRYGASSFFSLPVRRLYQDLSAIHWVHKVDVERVWPDTLLIRIEEHQPVARWNQSVLTLDGTVFPAEGFGKGLPELPQLSGPESQRAEVLQVYKKLSKLLSNYGMYAMALKMRDNQAWELTLANGVKVRLGKRDLEMRLHRFCKAYPAIFGETPNQMASVDLRYPHGLSVRWKE